ncbi:MAG TPA: MFS transporter [Solibacterales bacterium]|nr:MFS transporter [Bryobacterales bacterium]
MELRVYRWWVVAMLWCVCFFNYADRQAIFSVFPLLKTELRLSDIELGALGSAFMWVYAACGPFAGWLGDRLPRKLLILGALVFWSAITASTALCRTLPQLLTVRALGGLGEAFYFPAAMALLGDYHGPATRSRAMALHQSAVYAGTIAGAVLSGLIAQSHGWRASFVFFGALGVVLAAVLSGLLREPKRGASEITLTSSSRAPAWRAIFHQRVVLLLIAVFMGANFVASIFLTWMPSFLYRKFGMSLALSGFSATFYLQSASVLGVLAGGILADRLGRSMPRGRMRTQAVGLLAGVPFVFLVGWTRAVPAVILAMTGFGFFKGMYDANIFASLYDVVPVERRAAAAGLLNSLGWVGGGLAPVAVALASARFGMSAAISAASAIYLVCGGLLWRATRKSSGTPR